jgi:perosamine synthetase
MKKINYAGPDILDEDADYVRNAVLNGFYENYKKNTTELENALSKYLNVKHVLATNSATAALHLSLACLDLDHGDEVITTDSSCVASAMPIAYLGLKGIFVDVKKEDWNLDPQKIKQAITSKTRAIVAVHWNGHPCDIDAIKEVIKGKNIHLIEDAAPALGAEYKKQKVGSLGDIGCFSFQGAKVAIGGQGGAIVTNNSKFFEKIKILASYGRTDSKMQYWSDYIGWNYTMPNLPAALATSQLKRINKLLEKKKKIFSWYEKYFAGSKLVRLIKPSNNSKSTYCYPCIELSANLNISRSLIIDKLAKLNIDARPAQPRISKMPMFATKIENENSEFIETNGLILPGAFNLDENDIKFVCKNILELVS